MSNLFSLMTARMGWLNQQQNVSADNIARMHIPGEKAKELEEMSFKGRLKGSPLLKTHANHLSGSGGLHGSASIRTSDAPDLSMNGNNIDYQKELRDANEASARHLQMTKLYGGFARMIRIALGK